MAISGSIVAIVVTSFLLYSHTVQYQTFALASKGGEASRFRTLRHTRHKRWLSKAALFQSGLQNRRNVPSLHSLPTTILQSRARLIIVQQVFTSLPNYLRPRESHGVFEVGF